MKSEYFEQEDRIAALATPWGESALAVVRTSGPGSINALDRCFQGRKPLAEAKTATIHYGMLSDFETGEPVDEVTAAVFQAPYSYTGQESVELFVHGSLPGIERILLLLKKAGFRDAAPGEFTLRAFSNGKLDLTQAEAVQEIVSAKSRKAQALALSRLSGRLFDEIDSIKKRLVQLLSAIEVQLDYAEDEVDEGISPNPSAIRFEQQRLRKLSETYHTGRIYSDGAKIVLAGRTNSGKSSLFNLFLKEDRSIVSNVHGTTRDYIESWVSIGGIPARLFDTAGYRASEDLIEQEGIKRSGQVLEGSDLVLYLIDSTEEVTEEIKQDINRFSLSKPLIEVWNKQDLVSEARDHGGVSVSAVTGAGFHELEQQIITRLVGVRTEGESRVMIDSLRQKELLDRSIDALSVAADALEGNEPLDLIAPELSEAIEALGELTGEVTSAEVLEAVFSGFCVGK